MCKHTFYERGISWILALILCFSLIVPTSIADGNIDDNGIENEGNVVEQEEIVENYADDFNVSTYSDVSRTVAGLSAFAIYCKDDESLTFYSDTYVPSKDSYYNEKYVTDVYDGVDTNIYEPVLEHSNYRDKYGNIIVDAYTPWKDIKENIKSVKFDESFSEVQPVSTAFWFAWFENCESITGLEYLDTSKAINMRFMFANCSSLTSLDVSGFDTSSTSDIRNMFSGCSQLTEIDVSGFNTSKVTTMWSTFAYCSQLKELDVSGWETSYVTQMYGLFNSCSSLTSLDLSEWDTSSVTDFAYMFNGCKGLTSLDLSSFSSASSIGYMEYMFGYCNNIKSINIKFSGLSTNNSLDEEGMFTCCYNLENIDLSGFKTANSQNVSWMFYKCYALSELNLSDFDTSKVTSYENFAVDCTNLSKITIGSKFTLFKISAVALVSQQYWAGENNELKSDHHMIGVSESGTYYKTNGPTAFAIYSETDDSLIFYYNENAPAILPNLGDTFNDRIVSDIFVGFDDSVYDIDTEVPWYYIRTDIKSVSFDESFADIQPVSTAYWFYHFENADSFDVSNIDTTLCTDMEHMFFDCYKLTELDLSEFDTGKVTQYDYFAINCPNLKKIVLGESVEDNTLSSFDLFVKSKETLVSEQYWVDENGELKSEHYLIGVSEPGTYYATDGPTSFAVYSDTDNSLIFYHENNVPVDIPELGSIFNGRSVTDIYVGFIDSVYDAAVEVPWHDIREDVNSVSFDDSFSDIYPTSVQYWFYDFACAEVFDFTNFCTSSVTGYDYFMTGCDQIVQIILGGNNTSTFDLFTRTSEPLISQQYWIDENNRAVSTNYMVGINTPGVYYVSVLLESSLYTFAIYSKDDYSLTFYRDEDMILSPRVGSDYNGKTISAIYTGFDNDGVVYSESNLAPWYSVSEDIITVSFDESFDIACPKSTAYWFYDFKNTISFDLSYLNTSETTNMEGMFYTCQSVNNIDISGFDVSRVTTVNKMFRDCKAIQEIDVSNWRTSSLQNMGQFIQGCTSLTEVDFSMLDVSHCTAFANIFNQCTNLEAINVCNWDTSKGTGFAATFYDCVSLTTIYASKGTWDISSATNKTNTFFNCQNLVGGNGTKWDEDHITADMAHLDNVTDDNPGYFTCLEHNWVETDDQTDATHVKVTLKCSGCGLTKTETVMTDISSDTGITGSFDIGDFEWHDIIDINKLVELDDNAVIDFVLELEDINTDVPESDAELVKHLLEGGNAEVFYLSIDLTMAITSGDSITLYELHDIQEPVTITVCIPESIQTDKNGEYTVIRVHDEKAQELDTTADKEEWTVTFQTDKFSTYAIAFLRAVLADATIVKVDAQSHNTTLSGASFTLMNEEGLYYNGDVNGDAVWQSDSVSFETSSNGILTFYGLDNGSYTLVETNPPDGYHGLSSSIIFTAEEGIIKLNTSSDYIWQSDNSIYVANETGSVLPVAGGPGFWIYIISGFIFVVIACISIVIKKRNSKNHKLNWKE